MLKHTDSLVQPRYLVAIFVFFAVLAALSLLGATTGAPLTIGDVTPALGGESGGTLVKLTGTGFSSGTMVTFGDARATAVVADDHTLVVQAPKHVAGPVTVKVERRDGRAATLEAGFLYYAPTTRQPDHPAPRLVKMVPARGSAAGGVSVVVECRGIQAGAVVFLDRRPVLSMTHIARDMVRIVTPALRAGKVELAVSNPDGKTHLLPAAFEVVGRPGPPPPTAQSGP